MLFPWHAYYVLVCRSSLCHGVQMTRTPPTPCTSTAAIPKFQAQQRFNAHSVLSFNDALVVTPGISASSNNVQL